MYDASSFFDLLLHNIAESLKKTQTQIILAAALINKGNTGIVDCHIKRHTDFAFSFGKQQTHSSFKRY
jgi:hypothetical protein